MKTFNKKLYKSRDSKVIMGVLGGFGEYFNIDPVILRVLYAGISIFTAIIPGIFAYLIAALLMPNHPMSRAEKATNESEPTGEHETKEAH